RKYEDVWDLALKNLEETPYEFDEKTWQQFRPLFSERTQELMSRLTELQLLHGEVIPASLKTDIIRLKRSLTLQQLSYVSFHQLVPLYADGKAARMAFNSIFLQVIRELKEFARSATA